MIDLRKNQIAELGLYFIALALRNNKTFSRPELSGTVDGYCKALVAAARIRTDSTLTKLDLKNEGIGPAGVQQISDAIINNTTVTELILDCNPISSAGASYIADFLRMNTTLKVLHIDPYSIGRSGMIKIIDALKQNTTLRSLTLGENEIDASGMEILIVRSYYNLGIEMKNLNDRKEYRKALDLFYEYEHKNKEMISDVVINQALKSFTNIKDFQGGLHIFKKYSSRIENNNYIIASLIHLYMQSGDINRAEQIYNRSKTKTMGIYGAMMKGLIKNNMFNETIDLFFKISNPDETIFVLFFHACARLGTKEALILVKKVLLNLPNNYNENKYILTTAFDAFVKCDDLLSAEQIFPKIKRNAISYGNLMNAFNKNEQPEKTLDLYEKMKIDRIEADIICWILLINASSNIGMGALSQSIFEQIPKSFLNNSYIKNGKSACVDKAKDVFESLVQPDTIGYTSMINTYGLNGMGAEALKLFYEMPPELILEETYVCALNACSHSGFVDHARTIFSNIINKTEKIYASMVDCLSRAFLFEEAQILINKYESDHLPSSTRL
ncbi:unnamed protein product, partial [Rotaria sp. Silwood1]